MPLKSKTKDNKVKATHKGECQICSGMQKLPGNLLSTHGYRVLNNCFNGVCPGSKNLPYELSCELIKEILPSIEDYVKKLYEQKVSLSQPVLITPECFNHVWVKGSYGLNGSYQWKKGVLKSERKGNGVSYEWEQITFHSGESIIEVRNDLDLDLLQLATELNINFANRYVVPLIRQTENEIRRLEKKITDWKLQELKPI
jgi:hypothetical protein